MTENEATWATRVEDWRASGATAPVFCKGKGFSPGGLRYWASRLGKTGRETQPKEVRIARVVRAPHAASPEETPIVIEMGGARVAIRRGVDAEALRAVLDVLGVRR